jgi:hypothetical protein
METTVGFDCSRFTDYFGSFLNIGVSETSKVISYNYMYSSVIYDNIKRDYFESLHAELKLESEINRLFLISLPSPNSKVNQFKKSLIDPTNQKAIEVTQNIIIDENLIKTSQIKLESKEDFLKVFEFLYSGYQPLSFLASESKKINLQKIIKRKPVNNSAVIEFCVDYGYIKSTFDKVYLSYGGLDFGQFILASF